MLSSFLSSRKTLDQKLQDLEAAVAHGHQRYKDLVQHIQVLSKDKRALIHSLSLLGARLENTERGLTVVQKSANATLEELRALRRLEVFVRRCGIAQDALRDVEEARKERHQ